MLGFIDKWEDKLAGYLGKGDWWMDWIKWING